MYPLLAVFYFRELCSQKIARMTMPNIWAPSFGERSFSLFLFAFKPETAEDISKERWLDHSCGIMRITITRDK